MRVLLEHDYFSELFLSLWNRKPLTLSTMNLIVVNGLEKWTSVFDFVKMTRDSVLSSHGRYSLYQAKKVTTFDEIWQHVPHISFYQIYLCVASSFICLTTGFWLIYPVFGRTCSFDREFAKYAVYLQTVGHNLASTCQVLISNVHTKIQLHRYSNPTLHWPQLF